MSSGELDTRSRILHHTWKLMEQHQGQEVRVQDIAHAAGLSRQAVYLYFPSRADLLVETTYYVDQVLCAKDAIDKICAVNTGQAMLEAYLDFWCNYIPQIYGLAKALIVLGETDEAARSAWGKRMQDVRDGCCMVVDQLEKEKTLAPEWPPAQAVDWMRMMLSVENWEYFTQSCGWSQDQYLMAMKKAIKQMFYRG